MQESTTRWEIFGKPMRSRLALTALVTLVLLGGVWLQAQESTSSGIVGQVMDESAAGMPGAKVVVTNLATNAERSTTTNAQGDFSVPNLPPAKYSISVEKQGFATLRVVAFDLRVGEIQRKSLTMKVGSATESMNVTGEAPPLQTESAELGQVIDEKQIEQLPLNGRNVLQLATLSAGVSPASFAQQGRGVAQYGIRQEYVQVDGGRDSSTNYVIDGVYVRSLRFNNLSLQPSADTILEFNVLRNAFSTEYGQGQSVISMVTKSGSNQWNGSVYEFFRNSALDARNYFATTGPKPLFQQNQFGGTLGGPIIKDKFFFFAGYEGLRSSKAGPQFANVPDPAQLAGNFSALPPSQWPVDPITFQPFPGGIIPNNRMSAFALAINSTIPAPNSTGAFNYVVTPTFLNNSDVVTFRADQNLSQKQSLFERYIWYDASQTAPTAVYGFILFPQSGQNLSIGDTYLFKNNLINDFRLGWNYAKHYFQPTYGNNTNYVQAAGLKNLAGGINPIDYGRPFTIITGAGAPTTYTFGEIGITQGSKENSYSLSDTLSYVIGQHTLRFGGQFQLRQFTQLTDVNPRGNFLFVGTSPYFYGTGNAIADYDLGLCFSCSGSVGDSLGHYNDHTIGFFVNDSWRVTPRLTVNWGLRWEYQSPFVEENNLAGSFDLASGKIGYHKVPANIPSWLSPYVIPQDNFYPASIVNPNYNNWGPRIGLAYQLHSNTVIRSGFGVYYDNGNLNELQFTRMVPPFYYQTTIGFPPGGYTGALFPNGNQLTQLPAPFGVNPNNRTPYTLQWNLNIQQQLARNLVLELAYTGSESHRLAKRYDANENTVFGTGACSVTNPVCPYPNISGGALISDNVANANFNAFSARIQKNYTDGLSFLANFQWSKNIDNGSGEVDANDTAFSTNFNADRAASSYNQKYRFSGSVIYELPFGVGKRWLNNNGVTNAVLGNWQVQAIVSVLSGFYLTPTAAATCNCGGFVLQRADINPAYKGNPYGQLSNPTSTLWYDPKAFLAPQPNYQGNAGRSVIVGPGYTDFDFSLIKNFKITERFNAQFRAEFFNILNHPNFGAPDLNISDITAGQVTSTSGDGRDIQFGLKINF